jgi:hypothetical protein
MGLACQTEAKMKEKAAQMPQNLMASSHMRHVANASSKVSQTVMMK